MIEIRKSKVAYDKDIIELLERNTGLKLPKEYIEFLKVYNGGRPESNIVELRGAKIESISISTFFGSNLENYCDLMWNYNILKRRIPPQCIPIANLEGGNVICVNLTDDDTYEFLYLWDHEEECLYGEEITTDNMYLVAKSFAEFMKMIKPYKPTDEELSGYKVLGLEILDPEWYEKVKKEQGQ